MREGRSPLLSSEFVGLYRENEDQRSASFTVPVHTTSCLGESSPPSFVLSSQYYHAASKKMG